MEEYKSGMRLSLSLILYFLSRKGLNETIKFCFSSINIVDKEKETKNITYENEKLTGYYDLMEMAYDLLISLKTSEDSIQDLTKETLN